MEYRYDGSFEGLMCCVFECYERRELPASITAGEPEQLTFDEAREIVTDPEKARRVLTAIPEKISPESLDKVRKMFLSCAPEKELTLVKYLIKGFRYGSRVEQMLADETVDAVNKAVHHCEHEAHLLRGFIRFSDYGGYLAAVIEPKNTVIPLLAGHFTDRFRNEDFLIYDRIHRMALVYLNRRAEIAENIDFELPPAADEELRFRELWRSFYNSIGIEERYNPRCRMNLMPKRFWGNMTEMVNELGNVPAITENQ